MRPGGLCHMTPFFGCVRFLHEDERQCADDEELRVLVRLRGIRHRYPVYGVELEILQPLAEGEVGVAVLAVGLAGSRLRITVASVVVTALLRPSRWVGIHNAVAAAGGRAVCAAQGIRCIAVINSQIALLSLIRQSVAAGGGCAALLRGGVSSRRAASAGRSAVGTGRGRGDALRIAHECSAHGAVFACLCTDVGKADAVVCALDAAVALRGRLGTGFPLAACAACGGGGGGGEGGGGFGGA